ncbi:MAG: 4Fe-4S binding protein, partial [Dehalococcoidales bacterium]
MGIQFDLDKCTGCGNCVPVCPFGLLEIVDDKVQLEEGCTLCGACQEACVYEAILIEAVPEAEAVSDSYRGVWVFAEQRDGKLKTVAHELLAKGRELADSLKTEVSAVCFGHGIGEVNQLIAYGADKVYLVDSPELANNQEDLYAQQLAELIQQHKPEIVLAGATSLGRAFIPRVAAILRTGLTADCTGLDIDTENRLLRQTRP